MEQSSTNTEQRQMSDIAFAQSYVRDIGGAGNWKSVLRRTYDRLVAMFPHVGEPDKAWTERRVRAFLFGEAATVQFYEMVELHKAALVAKAERALIEEARKEHAEFIKKTASLRSLLEHQDEDFHSPSIERLGRIAGGVDRAGIEGE